MIGIENLKESLLRVCQFGNLLAKDLEDHKLSIKETIGLLLALRKFSFIFKNWQQIKKEFDDLDATEREQIKEEIAKELELPNEKIEAIINSAISWIIETTNLVNLIRD